MSKPSGAAATRHDPAVRRAARVILVMSIERLVMSIERTASLAAPRPA